MTRSKPAYLKALGRKSLPMHIQAGRDTYQFVQTFKNDFFAITSLYEGEAGKVILKVQRQAWFLLIPMRWAGRILAARERHSMERLAGLPGIPRLIGTWSSTGLIREYVEGRTLADAPRVDDDFHPRLRGLIDAIHEREMAYVDLEKPGNVLVGVDGRPCLFDFQIAWYWPRNLGGHLWPMRALLRRLQSGDRYHLIKLQRRSRPDQLSPEVLQASYNKPWFVRLHNAWTRPLTRLRRQSSAGLTRSPGAPEANVEWWNKVTCEEHDMVLSSEVLDRVESFRVYVEDTVATDDRYGAPVREDSDSVLATRFYEGASCWFEIALLPAAKEVRVGFFTTDSTINEDCEQAIVESGETSVRFVGQAFEDAGLDWPSPPVEHGKQGAASFYATPLKFEDTIDLESDELRDKTIRMLEGYLLAFGPALGAEEGD